MMLSEQPNRPIRFYCVENKSVHILKDTIKNFHFRVDYFRLSKVIT